MPLDHDNPFNGSYFTGMAAGALIVIAMVTMAVAGALAARKYWTVVQEQAVVIAEPTPPATLPDKTRDAAVEMSKACIKSGKDVYWDTFISEAGEAIHVACPHTGKAARRVIANGRD